MRIDPDTLEWRWLAVAFALFAIIAAGLWIWGLVIAAAERDARAQLRRALEVAACPRPKLRVIHGGVPGLDHEYGSGDATEFVTGRPRRSARIRLASEWKWRRSDA